VAGPAVSRLLEGCAVASRKMPADRRSMQVAVRTTCGQDDAAEELVLDVRVFFRSVSWA
jgi:hypothetical protein